MLVICDCVFVGELGCCMKLCFCWFTAVFVFFCVLCVAFFVWVILLLVCLVTKRLSQTMPKQHVVLNCVICVCLTWVFVSLLYVVVLFVV